MGFGIVTSVTRLSDFRQFLVTNFLTKVAQKFKEDLRKHQFSSKSFRVEFVGNFLFYHLVTLIVTHTLFKLK